jgi:uncharacterized protein (UPF0332 family)
MFDWVAFLGLAKELAAKGDEASRRSAISRAYYAVFNKARELLERDGTLLSESGATHEVVWRTLEKAGRGRRRLGIDGKRLREMRRKADYDGEVQALDKVTEDALATAESLTRLVDAEAASRPTH